MPVKEIVAKTIGFAVASLSLIIGAVLAFIGPHAYTDMQFPWLSITLPLLLLLLGLGTGALGVIIVGGIIYDARLQQRESEVHVTPREGPPDLPPAWGMGDIGRPGAGGTPVGGGTARVMSVSVTNWDVPVVIGGLFVWTVVALLLLAPR